MAKNQKSYTLEFKQQIVDFNQQKEYEEFRRKVKQTFDESKQRHMAVQGLRSMVVKKYNHHANDGTVPGNKENILDRNFEVKTIHQKWCIDITYIHVLKEGWTYLAFVMDLQP